MKQKLLSLTSLLRYVPKRASLVGAITLGVLAPAVTFAWGPSRDTYTIQKPADHVVFNSITNNPVQGDERNFMQVRESGASNSTYADSISLKPNTEYTMFVYYHNNASSSLNASGKGKATGAFVKAELPDYVNNGQKNISAEGYVGAANASPRQVFDEVTFSNTSGSNLKLSYIDGSATIHNKGATNGDTLSDSIVTTGAPLGYKKLDGIVPGCNDYAGYVTFRIKTGPRLSTTTPVTPTPATFTIQKDVRKSGATTWSDSVAAVPGDTVQYMVTYKNTGTTTQNNVVLKDALPTGETYVTGSTKLKNGENPAGRTISDNIVTGTGINIGNYAGSGVGYVIFDAKIADPASCGTTTQTNTVSGTVGSSTQSDTATVSVTKACETPVTTPPATTTPTTPVTTTPTSEVTPTPTVTPTPEVAATPEVTTPAPTPLPSTGPGNILGGAFGAGSLGLGLHSYLASRRTLRSALKR